MEWEEYHQKEELTTRLRNILEEYPTGIGPFKEFLQNADDATARDFSIFFDKFSHETKSLLTKEFLPTLSHLFFKTAITMLHGMHPTVNLMRGRRGA